MYSEMRISLGNERITQKINPVCRQAGIHAFTHSCIIHLSQRRKVTEVRSVITIVKVKVVVSVNGYRQCQSHIQRFVLTVYIYGQSFSLTSASKHSIMTKYISTILFVAISFIASGNGLLGFEENKGQVTGIDAQSVHFTYSHNNLKIFLLESSVAYQFEKFEDLHCLCPPGNG